MTVVLLEATVERCVLDTFDLWTRFETLPRVRRHDLVGDTAAVRRHDVTTPPSFAPCAITVVEGTEGYAGTVWIRRSDGASGDASIEDAPIEDDGVRTESSTVVLAVDDDEHAAVATRDLARFVEFVLMERLDADLDRWTLDAACRVDGVPERPGADRR